MTFETRDVERKIMAILKVLQAIQKPTGGRVIAQHLKDHGVVLTERAVRYHLKIMDERGLTALVGNQDGRTITERGLLEIKNALVKDKVGFAIGKIEQLAFRTTFDHESRQGLVPVNVSFFPRSEFGSALEAMKPAFDGGFCASRLVALADSGKRLGDIIVPDDEIGLLTVCSVVTNGALLKSGIPMDSRFSGILQISNRKPMRFTEIIHYNGCSLDPSEIFIRAGMTSVSAAVSTGNGEVLANFREVPAVCLPVLDRVLAGLKAAGLEGVLVKGTTSEAVCEVAMDPNRIGLVFIGGLNPVAAAQEAGIAAENHSMSAMVDYKELIDFRQLLETYTAK